MTAHLSKSSRQLVQALFGCQSKANLERLGDSQMSASIHGSIAGSRRKVIIMSVLTEASTSPAVITFVEETSTFAIVHVGRCDSGNQSRALYFTARSRKYTKVRPERPFYTLGVRACLDRR